MSTTEAGERARTSLADRLDALNRVAVAAPRIKLPNLKEEAGH